MKIGIIVCILVTYVLSYPAIKEDDKIISKRLFNRHSNNFYNSESVNEKVNDKDFEDRYYIDEYQNYSDNFEGSENIDKDDDYYDIENYSQPYQYELGYFSDQNNINDEDELGIRGSNQKTDSSNVDTLAQLSQTSNSNDEKNLKLDDTTNSENTNSSSSTNESNSKSSTDNFSSTLTTSKNIIETLKKISDLDKDNFYENKKSKELSAIHDEVDRLIKEMDNDKGDGFDIVEDIKLKADELLDRVVGFKKQYYD